MSFFCHLFLEKILKAVFIARKHTAPPWIHDLLKLAGESDIELEENTKKDLRACLKTVIPSKVEESLSSSETILAFARDPSTRLSGLVGMTTMSIQTDSQKIGIDKEVKKKVLNFAKLLERSGIKADKIILYGSHVKGKAMDYSDIDLCVVSSLFARNSDYYFKKIWHLATQIDSSLEPIPFTQQELVDKYSTLSNEIRKYGVRII